VRRSLDVHDRVADLPAERGELLLQLRLVVDVRRRGVVDPAAERLDDRLLDGLEAVLEEQRGQRRLQQRRENVPVAREPGELLLRDDALPLLDEPGAEIQLARDDGAARPRDDVRANLREASLRQVGIPLVQRPRDGELQDAVTEELQPLVRGGPVRRPRGMRECVVRPLGGQLVDQPREAARVAVRRLATGAT
jgi:hypothetical protein